MIQFFYESLKEIEGFEEAITAKVRLQIRRIQNENVDLLLWILLREDFLRLEHFLHYLCMTTKCIRQCEPVSRVFEESVGMSLKDFKTGFDQKITKMLKEEEEASLKPSNRLGSSLQLIEVVSSSSLRSAYTTG